MKSFTTKYLKSDIKSGLVVFLVALPLCLGIALASGAPLFSGIIAGIIGGLVVGSLSNSQLSVSGPAAGLTAIIIAAIASLGSFQALLLAGLIAGVFQLVLGYAKAGTISNYLPSNVIEGMLAAIGIIIILSQIPHAVGFDEMHEGDYFFINSEGQHQMFVTLANAVNYIHPGAVIIALVSLAILIAFEKVAFLKKIQSIPGALVAVVSGIVINEIFIATGSNWAISSEHLVNLPVPESFSALLSQFRLPDFSQIGNMEVWTVGATIAAVASIETLLCIEAADKLDPMKRYTNTNTELKAQGIGNILSSMIGGLPMTSVIVRTSANVNSGGKTKLATISHGLFLFIAVMAIPFILNKIPLATLAAVLLVIGYKLANPSKFVHMWKKSKKFQFIPFVATIIAIVLTDLLIGVLIGLAISTLFILQENIKMAYFYKKGEKIGDETVHMELAQEVSFLNKAAIKQNFMKVPRGSKIVIDASNNVYIDHDVLEMIAEFKQYGSKQRNIVVELMGFREEEHHLKNTIESNPTVMHKKGKSISTKSDWKGLKVSSSSLELDDMEDMHD